MLTFRLLNFTRKVGLSTSILSANVHALNGKNARIKVKVADVP